MDSRKLNPSTIMPSSYRTDGHTRVAPAFRGKPMLNTEQIEDVMTYLKTIDE